MATSKCGHCGEGLFELKTIEPVGGTYKVNMVQCGACGAVVGAVYDFNAGVMLQLQEKKIDDIAELVGQIDVAARGRGGSEPTMTADLRQPQPTEARCRRS